MTSENSPDNPPSPPSAEQLAARIDGLESRVRGLASELTWTIVVAAAALVVTALVLIFWPGPGPTTADDDLTDLLKPGPHCYNSPEEMAAARQRALAATDHMRWERDFTQKFDRDHQEAEDYPVTMIPDNPPVATTPAPPIPSITGPTDPGVPESRDPNLLVNTDRCFGVAVPPK